MWGVCQLRQITLTRCVACVFRVPGAREGCVRCSGTYVCVTLRLRRRRASHHELARIMILVSRRVQACVCLWVVSTAPTVPKIRVSRASGTSRVWEVQRHFQCRTLSSPPWCSAVRPTISEPRAVRGFVGGEPRGRRCSSASHATVCATNRLKDNHEAQDRCSVTGLPPAGLPAGCFVCLCGGQVHGAD